MPDENPRDIEEAELDLYMESADGEAPTEVERREYLRRRYQAIKAEYKLLQLNREELAGRGGKADRQEAEISRAFRENYLARKWVVRELRKAGEPIEDKFVPA